MANPNRGEVSLVDLGYVAKIRAWSSAFPPMMKIAL